MNINVNYTGAWMPFDSLHDPDASRRLARWIKENWQLHGIYGDRVVVTPLKDGNSVETTELLSRLADGAPRVTPRSDPGGWSGPVVCAWPIEETLAYCVHRLRDSSMVVFEWGQSPAILGWATAVGAFNAATGDTTPALPADVHGVFVSLLYREDYLREGAKAGRHRLAVQGGLRELKAAGLDQDFVVTYLIALGYRGDTRRVRDHCDAAGLKKVHYKLSHR
jgi:hypothetical protein